jgi:hypothetical protein
VLATLTATRTSSLTRQGRDISAALTGGYHLGFWVSAALVLLGAGVAAALLDEPVGALSGESATV